MYPLTEKRFSEFFRNQPESGMGYWVTTATLKDGCVFKQVVVDSGYVAGVKDYKEVPFKEAEIDHFVVTHDKWRWDLDRKQ